MNKDWTNWKIVITNKAMNIENVSLIIIKNLGIES